MARNNLTYVILDKSEIVDGDGNELIDFSQLLNSDATMLRYNTNKWFYQSSKGVIKYDGDQPSFLNGKTTYTHAEILVEMAKTPWVVDLEL